MNKKVQRTYKIIILIATRTHILLLGNQAWLCFVSWTKIINLENTSKQLRWWPIKCGHKNRSKVNFCFRLKLNLSQWVTLIREMDHNVSVASFELPECVCSWGNFERWWGTWRSAWCRCWCRADTSRSTGWTWEKNYFIRIYFKNSKVRYYFQNKTELRWLSL